MKKEKEISDLNRQLRDFVNENKKLSLESYNNKTISQNTLNDTIKAYKQQIALLNMEISDKKHLEEVNRNLEYELSKLKNEIILSHEENYEGQIQELREDNKVLRDEINKLRNEILQKNRNMKEIENKNSILQQQIDENSENIQNKENVIVNLTESSIENNDKMNNINHQLLSARETINLLKKKKYEYENEIDKLKDNLNIYNQNEIQLNKTNEERLNIINNLKLQLDEEIKANEKLRLLIKDLNLKLKEKDDTIDQLKNENFILNSKIEVIPVKEKDDNEKNIFKANLEKRTNEYVELRKTNSVLRNNLKDAEEKLITLTKQVENYKREFTKINEKIKGTKNDNARTLKEKEEELSNLSKKYKFNKIFNSKK